MMEEKNNNHEDYYDRELKDDMYWDAKRKSNMIFRIVIFVFMVIFILVICLFVKILCML